MGTYVALVNWTQQGVMNFRETVLRAEDAEVLAQKMGGRFRDVRWTNGAYDLVLTLEAPDDKTASAIALGIASKGNAHIATMRAYDRREMSEIIDLVP